MWKWLTINVEVVDYPAGVKHQVSMKYLRLLSVRRKWKWLTINVEVVDYPAGVKHQVFMKYVCFLCAECGSG